MKTEVRPNKSQLAKKYFSEKVELIQYSHVADVSLKDATMSIA